MGSWDWNILLMEIEEFERLMEIIQGMVLCKENVLMAGILSNPFAKKLTALLAQILSMMVALIGGTRLLFIF